LDAERAIAWRAADSFALREFLDASPLQNLLPEFRLRELRHVQTDHDARRRPSHAHAVEHQEHVVNKMARGLFCPGFSPVGMR
jgi:hypothetical protein